MMQKFNMNWKIHWTSIVRILIILVHLIVPLKLFHMLVKPFCNGAGKNFVDTLFGDILEALDITRAEMFVSLAVTSRKSLNLDLVWNAELLSSQLCGRMTRTLKLVISVT